MRWQRLEQFLEVIEHLRVVDGVEIVQQKGKGTTAGCDVLQQPQGRVAVGWQAVGISHQAEGLQTAVQYAGQPGQVVVRSIQIAPQH
ncbi:hypothetical protein D3C72_2354800 [compost metagenome]